MDEGLRRLQGAWQAVRIETGTVVLHPASTPQAIDVALTDGPGKGQVAQGVCEIVGGRLRLCVGPERPAGFRPEGSASLVELEPVRHKPRLGWGSWKSCQPWSTACNLR